MHELWKNIKAFQRRHEGCASELLLLDTFNSGPPGTYRYDVGVEAFERVSSAVIALAPIDTGRVQACLVKRMQDSSLVYVRNEERQYAERRMCKFVEAVRAGSILVSHYTIVGMLPESFPSTAVADARFVCERVTFTVRPGLRCKLEIQEFSSEHRRFRVAIEVDDRQSDAEAFVELLSAVVGILDDIKAAKLCDRTAAAAENTTRNEVL